MEVTAIQKLMKMAVKKLTKKSEDKQTTKTKNDTNIFVSLPDDVFIAILKRFPDAFLRYKAKYVCKQWFDIISNRILLDHASFILQKPTGIYTVRLVDLRKEGQGIEVKEQYLDIPHTGIIRSWCNEFLVIMDIYRKGRMMEWEKLSYDLKYGVVKELNINIEYGDYYVVHSSAPEFEESQAINAKIRLLKLA
ncbi:hypothetical protein L2E82_32137 [Cichorium intybus]|uniref:Uncharacterized protein n=1 Tax=Cichorium intybus TaxID=13427 RepID=A0ACB9BGQ9_CICIN|nr:hypothetical protein L2E82_32137 [Cichorium intybus]